MPVYRGKLRRRNKKNKALLGIMIAVVILVMAYIWFNVMLAPVLKTAAVNKAKVSAINTINNAVGEVLEKNQVTYDDLMSFDKDSNGYITSLNANTMQMNLLKYDITKEVIKELGEMGSSRLSIPLGTIVGGQIFMGRGPNIRIAYQPIGNVNTNISSTFSSAGINQTRQQIMLGVDADITVMTSAYNISTTVHSEISIADTVIVGLVPGSYTVIDGTNSDTDKAYIYGKSSSGSQSGTSSSSK